MKKKGLNNLFYGILSQITIIIIGLLLPRISIKGYGSEINGLLGSVTQIYSCFSLLEAGIGLATLQALYKSVSNDNKMEINSILSATNKYYKRIGIIYLIVVLLFSGIYPLLITTNIPTFTIMLVIIFNGLGNIINFLFYGKYKLLLQAEGKNYIIINLNTIINIVTNILKIILINQGYDVVIVQFIAMLINISQMVYLTYYIQKYYKWINLKVDPDFTKIAQSKNIIIHQLSSLVFNNTDTIFLTFFCGLKVVSVYNLYSLIFNMVGSLIGIAFSSCSFILGQKFHYDKKEYINLIDLFEVLYIPTVFALFGVSNFLILPFITLYTKGIDDIQYIDSILPILFVCINVLSCGRSSSSQTINFAGHFKQTQGHSLIEAIINILVTLVGINIFGVYGVLLGTIVALLYRTNTMIIYANKIILNRSPWPVYRRWILNLLVFCCIIKINTYVNIDFNSYFSLILNAIPYTCFTLIFHFVVTLIVEKEQFRYILSFLKLKKLSKLNS